MLNFIIYSKEKELVIYDYTINNPITTEDKINNWSLEVSSDKMDNTINLDINDYLYNNRQYNELYTITPTTLGFTNSFTDGLYKFKMVVNTSSIKEHYIILYNNINNRFRDILDQYNYTFTISDVGYINYIDDSSEYKTEEIRILSGLIDQLQTYQFQSYNFTVQSEINDILNKANRIAEILEN